MFQTAPTQIQRHQTRDLAALIDLYEANYLRLMQLVPELDHFAQGTVVSRVAGALDLFLTVQERFKYTTAISLTYRFEGDDGALILEPFARISIYHDVRAAEVVSHCRRKRVYARRRRGRLDRMPEVHRRFELNRFLLKPSGPHLPLGHGARGRSCLSADTPLPATRPSGRDPARLIPARLIPARLSCRRCALRAPPPERPLARCAQDSAAGGPIARRRVLSGTTFRPRRCS
jgi:uncharacterized protein YqiB (DUF1249 family)